MKRNLILLVCIFFTAICFSQNIKPVNNRLQLLDSSKIKNKNSNSRWHPYLGLHVSGDAEMFYIGPSFQAGVDFQLRKRIVVSSYIHYFAKKVDRTEGSTFFEKGKFKTITGALLLQAKTSKSIKKSFFLAGGIALQNWEDNYRSSSASWDDKRTTLTPAFRFGYFFPIQNKKATIEINGTGPYKFKGNNGDSGGIELLTQLSLGCRFVF